VHDDTATLSHLSLFLSLWRTHREIPRLSHWHHLISLSRKFLFSFSLQSMSRLSPEYPTIELIMAIFQQIGPALRANRAWRQS
jgi:hypothetical protein